MTWRNTILIGDVRTMLATLPDESVQTVVTSPPYWGLRDYGTPGQLGLEPTPEGFVSNLVAVFREVKRVLRKDGTAWVNLGDSYAHPTSVHGGAVDVRTDGRNTTPGDQVRGRMAGANTMVAGLKPKDLVGIPWRVAFALQADGWWLRSDVIWSKPNPMPESVTDRPTKSHEYLFLLSKSERYFYDAEAVREPLAQASIDRISQPNFANQTGGPKDYGPDSNRSMRKTLENFAKSAGKNEALGKRQYDGFNARWDEAESNGAGPNGRNRRTVWEIPTQPYAEAHFATYPENLVLPCIKAGTSEHGCCSVCGAPWRRVVERVSEGKSYAVGKSADKRAVGLATGFSGYDNGDSAPSFRTTGWEPTCKHEAPVVPCVVLDPFMGSGTTGSVAKRAGRDYVGVELNPAYAEMAQRRIGDQGRLL